MGRRGRAPKPTALRLLEGDSKHVGRINRREPIPRDAQPEPPESMADDVREIWDYTLAELDVMKIAATSDRDALICYCEAVVTHRKASAILARSSILVKGAVGQWIRNPALVVQRDSAHTIRAFAQEFGLTPSGRSRVVVEGRAGDQQSNPFAAVG